MVLADDASETAGVAARSDFPQAASISANAINGFRTGENYRSDEVDSRSEVGRHRAFSPLQNAMPVLAPFGALLLRS
jgi:hypothetical protein